jgi:hypothetical protein
MIFAGKSLKKTGLAIVLNPLFCEYIQEDDRRAVNRCWYCQDKKNVLKNKRNCPRNGQIKNDGALRQAIA